MCTSTSVVSTPGNRRCTQGIGPSGFAHRDAEYMSSIFVKCTVYGYKEASKHIHTSANEFTLVCSLAKPDPSAARECLVASLYRDLYQAAETLQSNQIAERAITKF